MLGIILSFMIPLSFSALAIASSKSFKVALNENDPFQNSNDFVSVQLDVSGLDDQQFPNHMSSGTVTLRQAMQVCAGSRILANILIFTESDKELSFVLRNLTQQLIDMRKRHPESRYYCRVFLLTSTCTKTQIRQQHFFEHANEHGNPFNWESDLYLVQYCRSSKGLVAVSVWEVYTVKGVIFANFLARQRRMERQEEDIVLVNLTDIWLAHFSNPKVLRRQDLRGTTVTAAAFINKDDENDNPFEIKLGKNSKGEEVLVSGLSVSIYRDVFGNAMNFTEGLLKIYFNQDSYFEDSFLEEKYDFDINIYHTGVTRNRTRVGQPLHPTFFDGIHAIFVQPSDRSVRNIYRKPFAFEMWSVLFYTWVIIFFSCKFTIYLHSKLRKLYPITSASLLDITREESYLIPASVDTDPEEETAFETWLWCIGTVCQQGWHTLPHLGSSRLIIVTALFFSVVCYAAYTGKIVSELYDVPKTIKALNQLLAYSDEVYLVNTGDTSDDILEGLGRTSPKVLKKIKFQSLSRIYSRLVERPGKACAITWPDTLFGFVQDHEMANFSGVDSYLCDTFTTFSFQGSSSLFIKKYSELEQLFNYRIIVGLERGFIKRYWKTYLRSTKLFCLRNNPKVTELDYGHVFFAFLILFLGMVACIAFLLLECVLFRVRGR